MWQVIFVKWKWLSNSFLILNIGRKYNTQIINGKSLSRFWYTKHKFYFSKTNIPKSLLLKSLPQLSSPNFSHISLSKKLSSNRI